MTLMLREVLTQAGGGASANSRDSGLPRGAVRSNLLSDHVDRDDPEKDRKHPLDGPEAQPIGEHDAGAAAG